MAAFITYDLKTGDGPLIARGAERAAREASYKAGTEAARAMRAEASRHVRAKKRFKVAAVNKLLVLQPTRKEADQLRWVMGVGAEVVPLAAFPYRQQKAGVKVSVNVGGGGGVVRSAFVAQMASGHTGVFRRARGAGRLPIRELFTSRVVDVFRDEGMVDQVFARARLVFGRAYERLMPLELQRLVERGRA